MRKKGLAENSNAYAGCETNNWTPYTGGMGEGYLAIASSE